MNNCFETTRAERCRSLLSRSSTNSAPAEGIEDASRRACSSDKSAIVGSRRSKTFLFVEITEVDELPEVTTASFYKLHAGNYRYLYDEPY
ncbi:hypothetical protein [Ignatzschineria cameli]|uniref:hypothetical protein n=1 Tax=Ignatzschineria cameli TaxID=2182793 RepID=UPI00186488B1|nr:hypothetical protein [Ignatzschineria cameli]